MVGWVSCWAPFALPCRAVLLFAVLCVASLGSKGGLGDRHVVG